MNISNIIIVVQILSAITLIALVLIQSKGTGLGRAFGSTSQTSFTRRGLEKMLFKLTFIICGIFISVSILSVVI